MTPKLLTARVPAAALSPSALALAVAAGAPRRAAKRRRRDRVRARRVSLVAAQRAQGPRVLTLSGTLIGAEEAAGRGRRRRQGPRDLRRARLLVKKGAVLARLDARAVGAQAREAAASSRR